MEKDGKITIPAGVNVWPHELKTARALAAAGYDVEFVRRSEEKRVTSPDVFIDGELWEMKAPTSNKLHKVQDNLRRAIKQSPNVVFDARRMKGLPNAAIERELVKYAGELRSLRKLRFVNKNSKVIDIK